MNVVDAMNQMINKSKSVDQEMIRNLLFEQLKQFDKYELVYGLEYLTDVAASHDSVAEELLCEFCNERNLLDIFGKEMLSAAYQTALSEGNEYISCLLLRTNPAHQGKISENDSIPLPIVMNFLDSYTLGERRAFAKGTDIKRLELLAHDTDYLVVKNLLRNPRVGLAIVLKMTSRRPQVPSVLEEVFASRKWARDYEVRKAIVFNPSTPRYIALAAVNFLHKQDLKLLAELLDGETSLLANRARQLLTTI